MHLTLNPFVSSKVETRHRCLDDARHKRVWVALFGFLLLLTAFPAFAQTFPAQNAKRVVDAADILPADQEAALDGRLAQYETETGRQFVVATIPSLEGYPIEDYGYRLGRAWGIGAKGKNDGTLLLVAPNDRKVRIEVGYGLEPLLTDAYSSVIINSQIVPRFKAGDFAGGINAGADAVMAQLKLTPEEAAQRLAAAEKSDESVGASFGTIIFWLIILFFFVLPGIFGRGKRGKRHGSGPVVIWGGSGSSDWSSGSSSSSWGGGGGFSGGGGSFGGGGASGDW